MTALFLKRRPTLATTFGQSCRRHVGRFAAAISKADALLGRTGDPVLAQLLATFGPGDADHRALATSIQSSPISRNLFLGRQSSYMEVGTLTHLFTRIRKKRAPQNVDTEFARTNQMRLVSIAQLQQMAQDVHDTVVTTTGDESAAHLEAVTTANKLTVLLGNALFSLAFKTVTDIRDIRVLQLLMRSMEGFASSGFDQEAEDSPQQPSHPAAAFQLWSRYQVRSMEPLANAFECSLLLAGAGDEERAAARRCGTDLALAMQALKELDTFLKEENSASPEDFRSLSAIIKQRNVSQAPGTGLQCKGECDPAKAAAEPQEQLDVAGEVNSVIRELADGVLGYAADCAMSDDLAAFRDIAASLRGP